MKLNELIEEKTGHDELDAVYADWKRWANMTASELRAWAESPISRLASIRPSSVISRNLKLLETPKKEWGASEIKAAKRAISFNSRMSGDDQGENVRKDIPFSKRDISLLNWGHRPGTVSKEKFREWTTKSGVDKARNILT